MKYRYAAEQIEFCTGKEYDTIYIVGGDVYKRQTHGGVDTLCFYQNQLYALFVVIYSKPFILGEI